MLKGCGKLLSLGASDGGGSVGSNTASGRLYGEEKQESLKSFAKEGAKPI